MAPSKIKSFRRLYSELRQLSCTTSDAQQIADVIAPRVHKSISAHTLLTAALAAACDHADWARKLGDQQ
jgi:hypothetical protein